MSFSDMLGFFNEPIPSFFFEVFFMPDEFDPNDGLAFTKAMADLAIQLLDPGANAFKSVSGMEIAFSMESINQGGWSTPTQTFGKLNNAEITLTRYLRPRHIGIMGFSLDPISGWAQETVQAAKTWEKRMYMKDVLIFIYHPLIKNPLPVGPQSFPISGFLLKRAMITKWSVSDLDSLNVNDPIVETIGLQCEEIQRLAVPPA